MLSRKPGSAEDSISPLAFNVFFPPLSYLGAWRCGKRFPCSSSLLSDLSLLPKNPNFSISCQTILHIIYLVALCCSAFWNIFSGVFSLLLSHTLPVIILIIILIKLFKTQGYKFHDIFFHRGLVIHSSGFIKINPRSFHYKNCNFPHCLLSPKILTSLSSLSMVSLCNHSCAYTLNYLLFSCFIVTVSKLQPKLNKTITLFCTKPSLVESCLANAQSSQLSLRPA